MLISLCECRCVQLEEALASRQRAIEQLVEATSHTADADFQLQERNAQVGGRGQTQVFSCMKGMPRWGGELWGALWHCTLTVARCALT